MKDQYDREIKAFESLRGVNSGNILRCYGSYPQLRSNGKITYNLVLEYIASGDFGSVLQSSRPPQTFSQVCDLWTAFIGVLEGLSLFHHSGVLKGDKSDRSYEDSSRKQKRSPGAYIEVERAPVPNRGDHDHDREHGRRQGNLKDYVNASTNVNSPGEGHSVADEPSSRVPEGVDYQR